MNMNPILLSYVHTISHSSHRYAWFGDYFDVIVLLFSLRVLCFTCSFSLLNRFLLMFTNSIIQLNSFLNNYKIYYHI